MSIRKGNIIIAGGVANMEQKFANTSLSNLNSTGLAKLTPATATTSKAGIVKPDGTTLKVSSDGTLSVNGDIGSSSVTFRDWT